MNAKNKEYATQVLEQLACCADNLRVGFEITIADLERGNPIDDRLLEGIEAIAAVAANVQTLRNQVLIDFLKEDEEELAVVLQFPTNHQ